MANFATQIASGSTTGKMVKVVATSTLGTTLHTAVTGTDDMDEVYIWAQNNHTSDVVLTIEWGGVSSPDDLIQQTIPSKSGLELITPGGRIQNGLVITAFAATANVISCLINVNRITKA